MTQRTVLSSLVAWTRPNRWADLRHFARKQAEDRSAGLTLRDHVHVVRLHDWSTAGACIDLPISASIGEPVSLTFEALQAVGRICWIADGRAGIEFEGQP